VNDRLMESYVRNIYNKNYSSPTIFLQVTIENSWDVFETHCRRKNIIWNLESSTATRYTPCLKNIPNIFWL